MLHRGLLPICEYLALQPRKAFAKMAPLRTAALLAFLAAGLLASRPSSAQGSFDVSVSWQGVRGCLGGTPSPAFTLTGVPQSSQTLLFALKDSAGSEFGGGKLPYRGDGKIAFGAFRHIAPCPASPTEVYDWKVEAYDAAGKLIATGIESRPFALPKANTKPPSTRNQSRHQPDR
jgi:hypothetical protein